MKTKPMFREGSKISLQKIILDGFVWPGRYILVMNTKQPFV